MKVDFTLINPVNHYRKTLVDNLAILNLRAVSEAAGFSTHVIDFQRKFLEEEKTFSKEIYRWFSDEIKAIESPVFGVSIMNASYIWGIMIAKIIKRVHPESVIIFGGPQITSLREMVFQDCPEVDFLLIFDGEETSRFYSNILLAALRAIYLKIRFLKPGILDYASWLNTTLTTFRNSTTPIHTA